MGIRSTLKGLVRTALETAGVLQARQASDGRHHAEPAAARETVSAPPPTPAASPALSASAPPQTAQWPPAASLPHALPTHGLSFQMRL